MTFVTRAQSGLPGPTDGMFVPGGVKTKFVVHWDGGRNPRDYADEIALLRSYIAHHFAQGWAGPAYNLAVGPITGYEYELRGLGAVGTHAPGANRDGIGVILIGGPGNLTEAGKAGLRRAYARANVFAGRRLQQLVHSDVVATACPGPDLRGFVKGGGLVGATGAPAVSGGANLTSRPTADIQRLVGATPDGIYGPGTTAKVRAWQSAQGLVADGIWGAISDARGFQAPQRLTVDGIWGVLTTMALQRRLGVTVDGIIGPHTTRAVQRLVGVTQDGVIGPITRRAVQRRLSVTQDGVWGPVTTRALQSRLNAGTL